jgi:hypothetical protein
MGWKKLAMVEIPRGEGASSTTGRKEVSVFNISSSYLRRKEWELEEAEKQKGKKGWALAGE